MARGSTTYVTPPSTTRRDSLDTHLPPPTPLPPQPAEPQDIYDEVDDSDYKVIVKGRLQEDDFIEEDDGVSGYADNGMEDWDRSDDSAEERGQSLLLGSRSQGG